MAYKIKKPAGRDFNFFVKKDVNWAQFGESDGYTVQDGYGPDIVITFTPKGIIFNTEASSSSSVVEYSFDGKTVHGELVAKTNRETLTFYDRPCSLIWFRVKSGSSGTIRISIESWGAHSA
jgi:hypothetical protein